MEISEEEFIDYERVRRSGVTNMFDVRYVSELSGLGLDTVKQIMKQYTELMKKYPNVLVD